MYRPSKFRPDRIKPGGLISIFQSGGHGVANLLRVAGLVAKLNCEGRTICIPNFEETMQSAVSYY